MASKVEKAEIVSLGLECHGLRVTKRLPLSVPTVSTVLIWPEAGVTIRMFCLGRETPSSYRLARYWQTEENLRKDARISVMAASREVQRARGGQGCILIGRGEIVTSGPHAEEVKAKFPWARGALLIHVEEVRTQR